MGRLSADKGRGRVMSCRTHIPLTALANRSLRQRAKHICTHVLCQWHLSRTGALPGTRSLLLCQEQIPFAQDFRCIGD